MSNKFVPFKPFRFESLLPADLRKKLRKMLVFTEQSGGTQTTQSPSTDYKFRYPAPNNQPSDVHIPSVDSKEDIYNTQYYTRDIRHHAYPLEVSFHPSLGIKEPPKLPKDTPQGSPGNKNPAVLAYDPSGTRSAMTTTHAARDALRLKYESNHNVKYEWEDHSEEILADCEAKGIPPVPGRPYPWSMPDAARIQRW